MNKNGGATFAIYPKGKKEAMKQVEQMRKESRINMFSEADYSQNTTANMWLCNKVEEFAERIKAREKDKLSKYIDNEPPRHLT